MSVGFDYVRSFATRWQLGCLAICLGLAGIADAQPAGDNKPNAAKPSDSQAEPAVTARQIQQLIEQLGADEFQVREAASAALLKVGEPALIQLATAERGKDAEVSSRAKAVRARIERDRFESISNSFKRDPDPTASYGLPGWKSFSKVAGTSRPAKRLFLEMLEYHPVIAMCLESIDGGQVPESAFAGLPNDPHDRLRVVVGKTCTELREGLFLSGKTAQAGDLIALLVAGQVIEEPSQVVHETTRLLCNFGAKDRMMAMPGAAPSGRKVMGAWFKKIPVVYASEVFNWARQLKIPEGRLVALRAIEGQTEPETKADAFICLSLFGLPEDLPVIDKYIDSEAFPEEFNPNTLPFGVQMGNQPPPKSGQPGKTEIGFKFRRTLGDVALAAGYRIAGLDLETIFPTIRILDGNIIEPSIGFPIDKPEMRAEARRVYREFRAKTGGGGK